MQSALADTVQNPDLFSAAGLVGLIFLFMIGVTVVGAVIAVSAKRLIRAVTGLMICLIGVASLYYFLGSPFVAMMQMLIYVGAVCVVIAFAIMVSQPEEEDMPGKNRNWLTGPIGLATGGLVFAGLVLLGVNTSWRPAAAPGRATVKQLGITLLTTHGMVFELISIVLLVAIIGALVLARSGRSK